MKKLMTIVVLMISTILVAQTAIWENPLPIVLGDNFEVQRQSIRTSDGNTIFFWSKTELDRRIMFATKLNEMGEYQWPEEKKVVLEHSPAVWLDEIIEISGNNFVLHFSHTDYKNGPFDNIYNIMDENGNILWNDSFSLLDYNDELYQNSLFKDIISGFNILCYNQSNDEAKIIHFDNNGNFIEFEVTNYSYANKHILQTLTNDNYYYMFYYENGDLNQIKLNDAYEPMNTAVIELNLTSTFYEDTTIHLFNDEFYYIDGSNAFACKISEMGELIWLTSWNTDRSCDWFHAGISIDGKAYVLDNDNDQIRYIIISIDGDIEIDQNILQGSNLLNYFHVSYNGTDKINVIVSDYEDDTNFLAQTVDLNGTMTYPINGLTLDITPMFFNITLISYPDKFSTFFLYTGDDRKTYICINTFNEFGTQIIPEDQMILESSFVSMSGMVCSQYIADENCILVGYVAGRGDYGTSEVYLQKFNNLGELLYEPESRCVATFNTNEEIEDVFINEAGFLFILYENDSYDYKCDVYDRSGNFVRTYTLDNGDIYYVKYHHFTEDGTIIGWRKNNEVKILKLDENQLLWDEPLTRSFPSSIGLHSYVTDNYLYCYYYQNSGYQRFLYRFEDDGSISTGWLNGFPLNTIENLEWIARRNQFEENYYFFGKISEEEVQLFAIDDQQQVFLDDLNITLPLNSMAFDLYVEDNIYFSSIDTLLLQTCVSKHNLNGQFLWETSIPNMEYGGMIIPTSSNILSLVSSYVENLSFASFDLDGNVVTSPNGIIIADSRGEKRVVGTHEMDNGQFMVIWSDQCVENILDGDGSQYNAICGQLFDFSSLDIGNFPIPVINHKLSNYPNPFNPETKISFSISNDSEIELLVYNIKGQKVKALLKDNFEKGNHTIVWDGFDDSVKPVSSGIYFYKLEVNGKIEAVKKCILLK